MLNTQQQVQKLYDAVATHLLTQRRRAMSERGECVYRASDGCRCAIGGVIKDEHYSSDFEGNTALDPKVLRAIRLSLGFTWACDEYNTTFSAAVEHLQHIHDEWFPDKWDEQLRVMACKFDLSTDVLSKFTPIIPWSH